MLVEWLKGLVLTALIFVPLERLLALRPEQKIFRRGWLNDLVYQIVNGQIIGFVAWRLRRRYHHGCRLAGPGLVSGDRCGATLLASGC